VTAAVAVAGRAAGRSSGPSVGHVAVIVLAKAPVPGRVKTRLCPPCTPAQAARLAAAALEDTLAAVAALDGAAPVLVLDAAPDEPAVPVRGVDGCTVIGQRGHGLDERLAAAFADVGGPALLLGMDTPQVTPALLASCTARLVEPGTDAVLGPAVDGGFWAIGLRAPSDAAFLGVPMSTDGTGAAQRDRLEALGLRVAALPVLRDVDTVADARAVAAEIPGSRFARALEDVRP
jgi:rSAM/selenodomain-associated transferase 1